MPYSHITATEPTFVVYSANEAATNNGAGFWGGKKGWTTIEHALQYFTPTDPRISILPASVGDDARVVPYAEICEHY